ncbi:MAG: hypothetical protein E7485_07690 [Ruminococcaceae bacterium]|nr:hypothetical protein [Oscillospiraceae bacterium]
MRYRALAAALVAMLMLSGCGNSGTSSTTSSTDLTSASVNSEDEAFFRQMYADDLCDKYNQLLIDQEAFFEANNNSNNAVDVQELDVDAFFAAAEKCISTLEAIIAIESPESLAYYHEQVIKGAQYEIKFLNSVIQASKYDLGKLDLSAQEVEELQAFFAEYTEAETNLFVDAYSAAMEAAAGIVQ